MPMNPRLLRPRATGFDPRSIANLAYWLDATDAATVTTVSGAVSSWGSKVGTGNATQGSANNRPAYTTAGRNGRNVITFDGSNDFMTTSTLSISQPYTVFWAGSTVGEPSPGSSPAENVYIFDGSTSSTRAIVSWNPSATTADNGRLGMFAGVDLPAAQGATAYNAWSVVSAVFDGASSRLRANGSQVASGNAGSGGIAALVLATRFSVASINHMGGPWGAFLIYGRALSDAECKRVERYLGGMFAVTIA